MKPINGLKTSREIYDYYASMQKTANYICKSINSALSYLENIQKQQSHQKTLEVFFLPYFDCHAIILCNDC